VRSTLVPRPRCRLLARGHRLPARPCWRAADRHDELWRDGHAWPAGCRRPRNARLHARQRAPDRRCSRPSTFPSRATLEWLWRQSRDRCTNHPGGWHHGHSWRVHRGRDGAPGRPNLSARAGERAHPRCGRGGPCATVSVHADGARRPISLGSPRPCRSDPSRAGLRDGGRQRDHGAGPQRPLCFEKT
jgi:hypothetical protein